MNIQEMKSRKKELGYTNKDIARLSGVPVSTVNKLFGGTTSSPRRATVLAVESVLATSAPAAQRQVSLSLRSNNPPVSYMDQDHPADKVSEPDPQYQYGSSAVWPRQGEYTLEDYLALPDEQRVELIDGVFYDMAAPFVVHQFIATQIGYQLMSYIDKNHGPCRSVLSPVDVQLDKDNKTVVQPDVLILCKPEILIRNGRVFGAPDFIIEILSKSTRRKDMTLKLAKYSAAGVREYWIIDPDKLNIVVYDLEHEETPVIYSFKDLVPVMIWDNNFSVDFNAVYDYIKPYINL